MVLRGVGIGHTRVRLPRRLSTAFKVCWGLVSAVSVVGAIVHSPALPSMGGLLGLAGYIMIIVSYVLSLVEATSTGDAEVTADALVLRPEGRPERRIPRAMIAGAVAVPRQTPQGGYYWTAEAELEDGDRFALRLPDAEAAQAFVHALGFGPDGARLRVSLAKPMRRLLHLPLGLGIYIASTFIIFGAALIGGISLLLPLLSALQIVAYLLFVRFLRPPVAVVGTDGVLVTSGFSRRRMYGAADPELARELRGAALDRERADEVLRVAQARARTAATAAELFARGSLPIAAWRQRVVTALDAGYRTSGNMVDVAAAVLGSGAATPDERVGAALALRSAGEPARVRIAASATANEEVRGVLDAVAEDAGDEVVERRLRRVLR